MSERGRSLALRCLAALAWVWVAVLVVCYAALAWWPLSEATIREPGPLDQLPALEILDARCVLLLASVLGAGIMSRLIDKAGRPPAEGDPDPGQGSSDHPGKPDTS